MIQNISPDPLEGQGNQVASDSSAAQQTSAEKKTTKPIAQLLSLIERLSPELDSCGIAVCRMPGSPNGQRPIIPLMDEKVIDLLTYQYFKQHDKYPSLSTIHRARRIAHGQLWNDRQRPICQDEDPTYRVFLNAAEEREGWAGSSSELLDLLEAVAHEQQLLKEKETLPPNSDAMGCWLSRNALRLRSDGIELFQPPRKPKKRLWSWRTLFLDNDASDTSLRKVSREESSLNPGKVNNLRQCDTSDASSEEERYLMAIFRNEDNYGSKVE